MKRFLAVIFLIWITTGAWAQSNECEQTLSQATEEFNAGHFYGIPALLKTCIDHNDFTNEQKVRAYLLLCQAYLIVDDPIAAEDSYLKLLKADPEYVATYEKDPVDVVYLSKKFTSTPVFTPSFRIGANTSFFRSIQDINTQAKPDQVHHSILAGFQVGAGVDWNINDEISVCANGIFSTRNIETKRTKISMDDNLTITEKQTWFDLPVYVKYTDTKGQWRPYAYAGVALNVMLGSKGSFILVNSSPTADNLQSVTQGPDVSLKYLRHTLNTSLVVGGGVRYKIGKDFVFADIRYMAGLSNLVKTTIYNRDNPSATDPINNDLLSQYRYVDPYFRLDNLSLSVGYVKPLYDPRRIKNARGAKSVSRKIRKQSSNEGK